MTHSFLLKENLDYGDGEWRNDIGLLTLPKTVQQQLYFFLPSSSFHFLAVKKKDVKITFTL